ncbi:MAG: hypothetical protein ACPG47_00525 [Leucothrix sp.]
MYQKMTCGGCYKPMLPKVLKESRGSLFTNKSIQYYCSICGQEQPPMGGGMRPWIKNVLIVIVLFVVVTGFLYTI